MEPVEGCKPQTAVESPGSWWITVARYTAAMVILLSPLLLQRFEPKWDALDQFLPAFTYLSDAIQEGRFPLWDPYTNCGFPFHAEPQNLTLNPLAIFLGMVLDSPSAAFNLFWALNWWWGGLGMIWLVRHFEGSPAGGFIAALAYSLSGFFLGHAEHTSYIIAAGWLPWVFALADRAVLRSSIAYALLAGAALGFCSYGGYPGLILFSFLALGLWLALRFLPGANLEIADARPLSSRALWIAATLSTVVLILLAVWSPVLHAFLTEGAGYTDRVGALAPLKANYGDPFTFAAAVSICFPYATLVGNSFMGADMSMTNAYMGMLTIPCAIFWGRKAGLRRCWWLPAFVVFMFVLSLGGSYGLRTLLYYCYPPLRYMRFSAPFRLFWILPLCLAGGLGASRFLGNPGERRTLLRVFLGWAAVSGVVALLFGATAARHDVPLTGEFARLLVPGLAVLGAGTVFLFFLVRGGSPRLERLAPAILSILVLFDMSAHLYNNSLTVWDLASVTGKLDANHVRSTLVKGDPGPRVPGAPYGFLNGQQVVKIPFVQGYTTMLSHGFNDVLCRGRFVDVLSGPARFWLAPGAEMIPSPEGALAALAATGPGDQVPVFVESVPGGLPRTRAVPGAYGSVAVASYAPERVELVVDAPGAGGAFLVSTERYGAGWRVLVDGLPGSARKVNLFFRGAFIPSGHHTVSWRYEPRWWPELVWAGYLVLAGALVAALTLLGRTRLSPGQ
jgi:hypothetical protein